MSQISGRGKTFLLALLVLTVASAGILLLWHRRKSFEYGLPITLGSTSAEVQQVLGPPTEKVDFDKQLSKEPESVQRALGSRQEGVIQNWYYTHGIVGRFKNDRLIPVGISPDNGETYKGFLAYSGVIIKGLRITDNKRTILRTLGNPTKVESQNLPAGTDADVPVVWPKASSYYWRLPDYSIEWIF